MRKLAVIGLGRFGRNFLESVRHSDFDVIAIDASDEVVNQVAEWVPQAVVADATDRRTLEELGMDQVQLAVVSMGGSLDQSILTVLHLRALGVMEIYVKATSNDHAKILHLIGATRVIHPEREVAQQLAQSLIHPHLQKFIPLAGDYAVAEVVLPPTFIGKSLRELSLRRDHNVSVIALRLPGDPKSLVAPTVDGSLDDGTVLVLIGQREALEAFDEHVARS